MTRVYRLYWMIGSRTIVSFAACWTVVVTLTSCSGEPPQLPEAIRAIKTTTISERPSGYVRRFSGVLAASSDPELAFDVRGQVRTVDVEAGQRVMAGQLLATIDDEPYSIVLNRRLAELQRARARTAEADLTLRNTTALFDQGVTTQKALESAHNQRKSADGMEQAAQAQVDLARRNLDHTNLLAPFDGIIAERRIEPHQEIVEGSTAFVIHGGAALEVELLVPEIAIDSVFVGQPVQIAIAGFNFRGQHFDGVVSQVGATVSKANAFPVRVEMKSENARLRAGLTAEVRFTFQGTAEQSSWLLPLTALLPTDGGSNRHVTDRDHFVFVYDPETATVHGRVVKMLNVQSDQALIREGLDEGDIVAVAGVSFLRNGQKVKILDEGAP